ncbi:MAG: hypothetical protein AMS17_04455 [Spirochaetes bacterium DG_61]|nr:MAG: hypothetical protein AMS17_04455 [Spirochaetes bacterium DG_61]
MQKQNIIGHTEEELREFCRERGFKEFHGTQLFNWIYHRYPGNFSDMTDLPMQLRQELEEHYYLGYLYSYRRDESRGRDATKYGFVLKDGKRIEAVVLTDKTGRVSFCISSQVGCALGCTYCETGKIGFIRNLSASEILAQVLTLRHLHGNPQSVLFMGMGEPLMNYAAVVDSLKLLQAVGVGPRKITISTCGIVKRIYDLAGAGLNVRLALSMGSAIDDKRKKLIPVSNHNSLSQLKKALIYYRQRTKRRASIEYILIGGVNDTREEALALVRFAKETWGHVNLIRYNPIKGSRLTVPSSDEVNEFIRILQVHGIEVSERYRRGQDIAAACGQLVAGYR